MKKVELTPSSVKKAIAKIRRRAGIDSDSDITIVKIASELGYSRQHLYGLSGLDEVLKPFKKINKNKTEDSDVTVGTKAYYKELSDRKEKEIKSLGSSISKLKDKLIDYQILMKNIEILEDKCVRLSDKNKASAELRAENERLRRQVEVISLENEQIRSKILNTTKV